MTALLPLLCLFIVISHLSFTLLYEVLFFYYYYTTADVSSSYLSLSLHYSLLEAESSLKHEQWRCSVSSERREGDTMQANGDLDC
jgi:hypothetical protein